MTNIARSGTVRSYFEGAGFERFERLHAEEHPGFVRRALRDGHDRTLRTVIDWLDEPPRLRDASVCDAGCGTGELSLAMVRAGARVHAVDFSARMVQAARQRAQAVPVEHGRLAFEVADIATLRGRYDTVVCVDVFARYPMQHVGALLSQLSRLARSRLVLSFTPKTALDGLLLRLGNRHAQRHGLPPLFTHRADAMLRAVEALGWNVARQASVSAAFNLYYCRLLELTRQEDPGAAAHGAEVDARHLPMPEQPLSAPAFARCPHGHGMRPHAAGDA